MNILKTICVKQDAKAIQNSAESINRQNNSNNQGSSRSPDVKLMIFDIANKNVSIKMLFEIWKWSEIEGKKHCKSYGSATECRTSNATRRNF